MKKRRRILLLLVVICLAGCVLLYYGKPALPTGGAGGDVVYSVATEPTEAPPELSDNQKLSYERMVRQSIMDIIATGAGEDAVAAAKEAMSAGVRYPNEESAKGRMMYHSAAALREILASLERREDLTAFREHVEAYTAAYGELTEQEQAGLPAITESDYQLAALAAHEQGYRSYDEMVLTFGGDNAYTTNVAADYSTSFGRLYSRGEIGASTVLNRLLPLTSADSKTFFCNSQIFSDTLKGSAYLSPMERASIYAGGGVDAVSVADRYSSALGAEGLDSTRAALEAQEVSVLENESETVVEDRNAKAVVLTLNCGSDMPNDDAQRTEYAGKVREAKKQGAVIAYVFWDTGEETGDAQRLMAHALADAGADVIIGCGTERVQGVEQYNGTTIFYGIGRLVWGDNPYLAEGDYALLVRVKVAKQAETSVVRSISVVPCDLSTSWESGKNNYQPTPQFGERAQEILADVVSKSASLPNGVSSLPHFDLF